MSYASELAQRLYEERGFTDDLPTLGLGLAEEAGEICKAINQTNPKYIKQPGREIHSLREELVDCMVYLLGIANVVEIDLIEEVQDRLEQQLGV